MRYSTRTNLHVDRCASAWIIRRLIDPDAEFVFVDGQTVADGAIPFDRHGATWGHQRGVNGEEFCTFETLLALHDLTAGDPALRELGRIIHGADITADLDETLESAGVDLLFRGLRMVSRSDAETLERGFVVMDALYAALQADHASTIQVKSE